MQIIKCLNKKPKVSIILLDWSCREQFNSLSWLNDQSVDRDTYELIWIELYDRKINEVIKKADTLICLNQHGVYHKHKGYNQGLLLSNGEVVCICDSDAVFPYNFVESIIEKFDYKDANPKKNIVLMHYEWRTTFKYPDYNFTRESLYNQDLWQWWPLVVNEGACVTFLKSTAIKFGGFDEDKSYRGYMCGPYELAWRLINAGYQEIWHDPSVALWHFSHPDPVGTNGNKIKFSQFLEKTYPSINGHALMAVEAFSTGRVLPLMENQKIWNLRMKGRVIGSDLEKYYSNFNNGNAFSNLQLTKLWIGLIVNGILISYIKQFKIIIFLDRLFLYIRTNFSFINLIYLEIWALLFTRAIIKNKIHRPVYKNSIAGFNIISLEGDIYFIDQRLGNISLSDSILNQNINKIFKTTNTLSTMKRIFLLYLKIF
jgi:hypothetical protein